TALFLDCSFDTSAVGSTTFWSIAMALLRDCSFDTSAVGSITCGVNCGSLSCDICRCEAAMGCPGISVHATMLGSGTSRFSLTLGGVTIVWWLLSAFGGTDKISCFASL